MRMPVSHPGQQQMMTDTSGMNVTLLPAENVLVDGTAGLNVGVPAPRPLVRVRAPARRFEETPVHQLTIGLLDTYKRINENYYEKKRRQEQMQSTAAVAATAAATAPNESCDDKDSDYVIIQNEVIHGRYRIDRRIGKGSFGQVVTAFDEINKQEVAIKIIKSKKPFTKQADTEIRILKNLNENDTTERGCVVRLLDTFMHKNHRCLVFEKLAMNLYDLLRSTKFVGVSFDLIRKFARQILVALRFFAQQNVNIIHCDLKPENILLVEPRRSTLKVIDFGSSCTASEKPFVYIQSRFYRSPEVMLQCGYTHAIDMWSLGCILIEMHSGTPLFSGQNEMEQMHLLVGSKGLPPDEMLREGRKVAQFFDISENESGQRQYKLKDLPAQLQQSRRLTPLTVEQALGIAPNSPDNTPFRRAMPGNRHKKEPLDRYLEFADLLNKMLTYSPAQRITPEAALNHPFLQVPQGMGGATVSGMSTPHTSSRGDKNHSRMDPPKRPLSQ